jgi:DNA-binding NarL/FixJ family response regulator
MTMPAKSIRVMIVDDHPVVRMGLKTMLESEDDISVVGMAGSAGEALKEIERADPEVVLMDLRMPGMDGADAIAEMRHIWPAIRILVLTNYQEDEYISKTIRAGAMGYLLKCTPQEEIVKAVHTLHEHGRYIPDDISRRLMETLGRDRLSERELEVLALVCKGCSNKEIAEKLFISDKTARNHVTSCLMKLGASDRTEAATTAIKRGLIRIDN